MASIGRPRLAMILKVETRISGRNPTYSSRVQSWVESAPPANARDRLVLQVAPRGHTKGLVIVEADPSLVSDRLWLEDLSENLCHGTLVLVLGSRSSSGIFAATRLQLTR